MRPLVLAFVIIGFSIAASSTAQQLPGSVRPDHYDVAFVVDLQHERFEGSETIRVHASEPVTRVVLNATDLRVRDATIGSGGGAQKADTAVDAGKQTVTLTVARVIPRGTADIHVRFSGTLNDQLRGFYISKANNRKYAVTQFESSDARRAFPCFDEPAFKATFAVTVTLDQKDTAISNGRVLADTPGPGAGQHTAQDTDLTEGAFYMWRVSAVNAFFKSMTRYLLSPPDM